MLALCCLSFCSNYLTPSSPLCSQAGKLVLILHHNNCDYMLKPCIFHWLKGEYRVLSLKIVSLINKWFCVTLLIRMGIPGIFVILKLIQPGLWRRYNPLHYGHVGLWNVIIWPADQITWLNSVRKSISLSVSVKKNPRMSTITLILLSLFHLHYI